MPWGAEKLQEGSQEKSHNLRIFASCGHCFQHTMTKIFSLGGPRTARRLQRGPGQVLSQRPLGRRAAHQLPQRRHGGQEPQAGAGMRELAAGAAAAVPPGSEGESHQVGGELTKWKKRSV